MAKDSKKAASEKLSVKDAQKSQDEVQSGTPQEKSGLSSTNKITLGILGFVLLIFARGLWLGVRTSATESLDLPSLEAETIDLPAALSDKQIPLQDLHKEIEGKNLDVPRAFVALYSRGKLLAEAWGEAPGLKGAIANAYDQAVKNGASVPQAGEPTEAMLVVPTDRTAVRLDNYEGYFSNVHRGVQGAFVEGKKKGTKEVSSADFRLSPTTTVATNIPITTALEAEAKKRKLKLKEWLATSDVYSVKARQFYIPIKNQGRAQETLRGNQVIPITAVTKESVTRFTDMLTAWMFNNLKPDGRLTYMYEPSLEAEARGNNMIRQWMGTVAMGRAAKLHPDRPYAARSKANIEYNLRQFYKTEGDLGYIEWDGNAKLGAAALAMISLIESPAREEFAAYEKGLLNLTLHQWQESGEFYCFFKPKSQEDKSLHNFYPGETLLSWAFLYDQNKDQNLLAKSMTSYAYYKKWHLANRNPAFIPWHTQAYYTLWKTTKNKDLAAWIFEMNDWLIDTMQANSRVAYDDTIGRFYDPLSKKYGAPHASSTGVYIEGLIDAFALAREIGDKKHEEKYRQSILLGLRSSMQLQFQDDIDMFFIRNKNLLRGGVRTTEYDNQIRVDNVQHVLMGVQKVLHEFKPEDYKY